MDSANPNDSSCQLSAIYGADAPALTPAASAPAPAGQASPSPATVADRLISDYQSQVRTWQYATGALALLSGFLVYRYVIKPQNDELKVHRAKKPA